jgi:hypothetical protein
MHIKNTPYDFLALAKKLISPYDLKHTDFVQRNKHIKTTIHQHVYCAILTSL